MIPACSALFSSSRAGALDDVLDLEVVHRHAPLEEDHQQERVERVAEVVGVPLLVLVHPQDAVADVAVLAEDVGERVVDVVVGVLPLLARAHVVPLVDARAEVRVAHPVVLAVHHVVADLHVLQDLGDRERGDGERPGRREVEQRAAEHLELLLALDDAADVGRVVLAEVGQDALAQRVHLRAERLELVGSGLRVRGSVVMGEVLPGHRSTTQSPTGAETQIWMSSSGSEDSAPESTLRTVPSVLRVVQEKQMPIRQPKTGAEAGVLGLLEDRGAGVGRPGGRWRRRRGRPRRCRLGCVGGLKSSRRSRGLSAYAARTRSIIPAGPQAQVSVSRKPGTRRRSSSSLKTASPWRRWTVTSLSSAAIRASSSAKIWSSGGPGVVEERHGAAGAAVVPVAQQRAHHRHRRRDARAAGDEEQRVDARRRRAHREGELALRLGEVEHLPGLGVDEVPADLAVGVGRGRSG